MGSEEVGLMDADEQFVHIPLPTVRGNVVGHNVYASNLVFKYRHPEWFWKLVRRWFKVTQSKCGHWEQSYKLIQKIRY